MNNFRVALLQLMPEYTLDAYRHPQKYKLLISECIEEPFIRKDYRR